MFKWRVFTKYNLIITESELIGDCKNIMTYKILSIDKSPKLLSIETQIETVIHA